MFSSTLPSCISQTCLFSNLRVFAVVEWLDNWALRLISHRYTAGTPVLLGLVDSNIHLVQVTTLVQNHLCNETATIETRKHKMPSQIDSNLPPHRKADFLTFFPPAPHHLRPFHIRHLPLLLQYLPSNSLSTKEKVQIKVTSKIKTDLLLIGHL